MGEEAARPTSPNTTLRDFKFEKVLNQDQSGRRLVLLGSISSQPSLLLIERAAFPSSSSSSSPSSHHYFSALPSLLSNIQNLGANDVYHWYMASLAVPPSRLPTESSSTAIADSKTSAWSSSLPPDSTNLTFSLPPDLKLNLIHPCTPTHIKKYTPQLLRSVLETPSLYHTYVSPLISRSLQTHPERTAWVHNIIRSRKEQEDIIYRQHDPAFPLGEDVEGWLLLPDMNWDQKTMESLRVLGLVERGDLRSLRDLKKGMCGWLRGVEKGIKREVQRVYGVEGDGVKIYMHYQPTYYHLHFHVVSVSMEPNATQAIGKAFSLPNIISQLETMAGGDDAGMQDVELSYVIGEESEVWREVFGPLKEGKLEGGKENEGGKG